MKKYCLPFLWLATAAFAAHGSSIIVSDPFTDGSRTNATGGDPLGLVYYLGQTTATTLTVTNDNAGLGSGNALLMTPVGDFQKYLAYIGPVILTNLGDSVTVSFDLRFTSPPTNINAGFRCGLYNSNGTRRAPTPVTPAFPVPATVPTMSATVFKPTPAATHPRDSLFTARRRHRGRQMTFWAGLRLARPRI